MVIPLALALTFLLLFSAFKSIEDALLILLHTPLALVDGVAALGIAGMTWPVSAAVGFIALLGQAVLMTALLASLGLVPAALSHAIGSETQRPIAVVVVGGTISAAILTLLVLPVSLYWMLRAKAAFAERGTRRLSSSTG